MDVPLMLNLLALFLLVGPCCARARFRFAIALLGEPASFSGGFHQNLARIHLQQYLTNKYPNMVTDHDFYSVKANSNISKQCDPQILGWANAGYDLIFGVLGHQLCFAAIAPAYPNTTFVVLSGTLPGTAPNYAPLWVRNYQNTYLAGLMAGWTTKTKKVCLATSSVRSPVPTMDYSAFCRGVNDADPGVELHDVQKPISTPAAEQWVVNVSRALGCDTIFIAGGDVSTMTLIGNLGMMTIGFFSDSRLIIGESVVTSVLVDYTPLLVRAAEAVLNGTLAAEKRQPDWWMGYEWGGMVLADPSFRVAAATWAKVQARVPNASRAFCGRVCPKAGCLCNAADCCLTDAQLNSLLTLPDFVIEHGVAMLPGMACRPGQRATWHLETFAMECTDCPAGTYAYNADQVSECRPCPAATYSLTGSVACAACPAGTSNNQLGQGQCPRCPPGTIAANPGAAQCNVCLSGLSSESGTECLSASLVWLAGVGAGVAVLFLLLSAWAWLASRNMRKLRKQFSNDNVAVECAAAIARLDLQSVAWLSGIPKPNCIQMSFIRIVKILDEVRKYVPDQLLQSLAAGADGEEEVVEEPEEAEVTDGGPPGRPTGRRPEDGCPNPPASTRSPRNSVHVLRLPSNTLGAPQKRSMDRVSITSCGPGHFVIKKVTYLLVQFDLGHHECSVPQAETNLNAFLGHLVETAKSHSGTLGTVSFDRAVVHWGTGKRAVAEAPLKAVETALALARFAGAPQGGPQGGPLLCLNMAVGCGSSTVGVVETATNHFFVVGGREVRLVERTVVKDWRATLGVQLLVTEDVKASVQYSYVCHPRIVEGAEVLWEPVARKKETGEDEWMYQLQEGEESVALDPATLLSPFLALQKGDAAQAEALAVRLRETVGPELLPTDVAALQWLAGVARGRL